MQQTCHWLSSGLVFACCSEASSTMRCLLAFLIKTLLQRRSHCINTTRTLQQCSARAVAAWLCWEQFAASCNSPPKTSRAGQPSERWWRAVSLTPVLGLAVRVFRPHTFSPVTAPAQALRSNLLALPDSDRSELADLLLASLETPQSEAEEDAFDAELDRRAGEVRSGQVEGHTPGEFFAPLEKVLAARR